MKRAMVGLAVALAVTATASAGRSTPGRNGRPAERALALAAGAAGDPGFGNGGVLENAAPRLLEENGDLVAYSPNGTLFRFTANGSRLPFAYQPKRCGALLAVRPDGTLLAACGATIQRLTPDGRPDGDRIDTPGVALSAVAVGPDGTVAASGRASDGTTLLLRFLRDDTPDVQFGRVVVPGQTPFGQGLAVDSVGRILIANGALRRYLANGQLDSTFTPPSPAGTIVALAADGRIDACCVQSSIYRLLANGALDSSFGTQGAASLPVSVDMEVDAAAIATEPNGATLVVGGELPAHPMPGSGYVNFYAQRIRPDGTPGAAGDSAGFFNPDNDCWDETGDWVGVGRNGAIFVGGSACDDSIEFVMHYTHNLHRAYGPFLTLGIANFQSPGLVVSGTFLANHSADAVVYVRATNDNDAATGPRLHLQPGSRVGGNRLTKKATSITASVGAATPFRLVLPTSEYVPQRDYDLIVVARRPHLRYRATVEQIFGR